MQYIFQQFFIICCGFCSSLQSQDSMGFISPSDSAFVLLTTRLILKRFYSWLELDMFLASDNVFYIAGSRLFQSLSFHLAAVVVLFIFCIRFSILHAVQRHHHRPHVIYLKTFQNFSTAVKIATVCYIIFFCNYLVSSIPSLPRL